MAHSITSSMDQTSVAGENTAAARSTTSRTVPKLLACGILAGPLFVAVGAIQALTVPGFDLTRHALSLLEVGPYGAVQIANFLVSGALLVAFAAGLRQALNGRPAGISAPLLVAICGLGFIGGAFFHPDPGLGFPPGTPDAIPTSMSTHAVLHMVCGSIAFLALIAVCFVLARPFAVLGQGGMAAGLRIAGGVFAIGLVESFVGGPLGTLVLFVTAALPLLALALAAARLRAEQELASA